MSVYTGNIFEQKHITKIRGFVVFCPFRQKNPVLKNRREYIDIITDRLEEIDREMSNLEKLADKALEEVKSEYYKQIKDLFLKKEELQNKVARAEKASGNAWEDMKAGTELSWEVFNDSVKSTKKKTKR